MIKIGHQLNNYYIQLYVGLKIIKLLINLKKLSIYQKI